MKKNVKKKNRAWFVSVRKSYLPSSWQGGVIYLIYVAYTVSIPIIWCENGHHLISLFAYVVPLVLAGAILTQYVAHKKSR